MADISVGQMDEVTSLTTGDEFMIERSGVNKRIKQENFTGSTAISKTIAQMTTLIGTSALVVNALYLISDLGAGVYIRAVKNNALDVHGAVSNGSDYQFVIVAWDTTVGGGGYISEAIDQRNNKINYYSLATWEYGNELVYENTILGDAVVTISGINATGEFKRNIVSGSILLTANVNASIVIDGCEFSGEGTIVLDPAVSVGWAIYKPGVSTFKKTIAIVGLTTLDITAAANYVGIVYLTSTNATETINLFANFPTNHPVRIYPETGLVVTFTHATGANQPICAGGISAVIDGTTSDWIEFTRRETSIGSGVYRIYQTNGETY